MEFPKKYKILSENSFTEGAYSLDPIRYEDRFKIMNWRNEQIYHLRQSKPLTNEDQENYFNNVVAKLFDEEKPSELLFSYLENGKCIGYGGLVHINWIDRNAEISFIIETELEREEFNKHWGTFLDLIEEVAFIELKLHKVFTYAFDLRPQLYKTLELKGFNKEAVLKEHCLFNSQFVDVVIHSKKIGSVEVRKINKKDKKITFDWANDPRTRSNSYTSHLISFEEHSTWFDKKLNDENSHYLICEFNGMTAGLVRFDFNNDEQSYEIGITIDKDFRGKKLASLFLKKSCEKLLETKEAKIIAFIKQENISSKKAFERAGFKFQKELIINDSKSFKYLYEH